MLLIHSLSLCIYTHTRGDIHIHTYIYLYTYADICIIQKTNVDAYVFCLRGWDIRYRFQHAWLIILHVAHFLKLYTLMPMPIAYMKLRVERFQSNGRCNVVNTKWSKTKKSTALKHDRWAFTLMFRYSITWITQLKVRKYKKTKEQEISWMKTQRCQSKAKKWFSLIVKRPKIPSSFW